MKYVPAKENKTMKIAFDAKRAFQNESGLGNYSRDHIRLCDAFFSEHELQLFTPGYKEKYRDFYLGLQNAKMISPKRGLAKISPAWWRSFGLVRELGRYESDIFHGLSASLPSGIQKWNGLKVVTIHDLIFEKYPRWYKKADRVIYRRKTQHACKFADKIVAISEETATDLQTFYNIPRDRINVIYQSCHPAFLKQTSINGEQLIQELGLPSNFILYVGTIEGRKNLGPLLEAIGRIGEIPLVVVGKRTKYWKKIEHLLPPLIRRSLFFHPEVNMEQLAALYKQALFTAYPSQAEGFGIPIVESIFSGKAAIAGSSPCLREVGGEAALYVNPLRSEEVEEAVRSLLFDTAKRAACEEATIERRSLFLPENLAPQWQKIYFDV